MTENPSEELRSLKEMIRESHLDIPLGETEEREIRSLLGTSHIFASKIEGLLLLNEYLQNQSYGITPARYLQAILQFAADLAGNNPQNFVDYVEMALAQENPLERIYQKLLQKIHEIPTPPGTSSTSRFFFNPCVLNSDGHALPPVTQVYGMSLRAGFYMTKKDPSKGMELLWDLWKATPGLVRNFLFSAMLGSSLYRNLAPSQAVALTKWAYTDLVDSAHLPWGWQESLLQQEQEIEKALRRWPHSKKNTLPEQESMKAKFPLWRYYLPDLAGTYAEWSSDLNHLYSLPHWVNCYNQDCSVITQRMQVPKDSGCFLALADYEKIKAGFYLVPAKRWQQQRAKAIAPSAQTVRKVRASFGDSNTRVLQLNPSFSTEPPKQEPESSLENFDINISGNPRTDLKFLLASLELTPPPSRPSPLPLALTPESQWLRNQLSQINALSQQPITSQGPVIMADPGVPRVRMRLYELAQSLRPHNTGMCNVLTSMVSPEGKLSRKLQDLAKPELEKLCELLDRYIDLKERYPKPRNPEFDCWGRPTNDSGLADLLVKGTENQIYAMVISSGYVKDSPVEYLAMDFLAEVKQYKDRNPGQTIAAYNVSGHKHPVILSLGANAYYYDDAKGIYPLSPSPTALHTKQEGKLIAAIVCAYYDQLDKTGHEKKAKLTPAQVFGIAARLNQGQIYEAAATCHYALRHMARIGINDAPDLSTDIKAQMTGLPSKYKARLFKNGTAKEVDNFLWGQERMFFDQYLIPLHDAKEAQSNREYVPSEDDGGIWYHLFGIFHLGLASPSLIQIMVGTEHYLHWGDEYKFQRRKYYVDNKALEEVKRFHTMLMDQFPSYKNSYDYRNTTCRR